MGYLILIRNNATGEERWRSCEFPWDDASEFWWTEGNMGCDCNLFAEFARAAGEEPEGDDWGRCGDVRYTPIRADVDGRIVPLDSASLEQCQQALAADKAWIGSRG